MRRLLLAALIILATPGAALQAMSPWRPDTPAEEVSEARLRADVEALVAFGTRHTLSSQDDPKRGIGAALRWGEAQFRVISKDCGGCLTIALPEAMVSGARIPVPTRLVNVLAIQKGSERPNEVVIVQGHIDSRVSGEMDATSDAPGANDNASGSALVIEAARALSRRRYPTTVVYALLSGEEQGLHGGKLLADWAKAQGWTVKAVLNNDIVGGSKGSDGLVDNRNVRVFSEGPRADASVATRAAARRFRGENDSPSRNLSRFIAGMALKRGGLAVRQVWRTDRMGRGGDHIPFLDAGLPAIRFSAAIEDYEHQHQDVRTEGGVKFGDTVDEMDFAYLATVTRLTVATLDMLARAPMPPAYRFYRRRTDAADWDRAFDGLMMLSGLAPRADEEFSRTFKGLRGDDWIFGISAMAHDGSESPISSAVPGGAFAQLP
jgi:murein DD-endopeptidase MepM/ murein hydrolase activator NlpD